MLNGLRVMAALLVLRDKVVRPILAAAQPLRLSRGTQNSTPIDRPYETMRLCDAGNLSRTGDRGLTIHNFLSIFWPNGVTCRVFIRTSLFW